MTASGSGVVSDPAAAQPGGSPPVVNPAIRPEVAEKTVELAAENPPPGSDPVGAARQKAQQVVLLLPTLLRPLSPPLRRLPRLLPPPVQVAETRKQPGEGRLGMGLLAFGTGYSPAPGTQRFGFGAGLCADWRLGQSWQLQVSPLWRVRAMGDFIAAWEPQNDAQLRYSFGFESDEYTLEGMASHWLEIPIGLQWRRGPWRAEAGVAPGFLLGIQGRLTHLRETSLTPTRTDRKAVRLDGAPFYKNYVAVFGGGRYALSPRLELGLRLHYLGGDFRRQTDEYTPPRQTLWLDAGLHWNLF